ncbi:MAG TPA: transglutaminase domain-containing protein [Clostridia bacterium]|nr:transglutaminase domain-containing protein [Clostridia bacterium]
MPGLTVYEYGKSLLNSGEKACYSQIAQALKNVSPSVTVKTNITPETFEKIYQYYLYDHTEIFYLKNSTMKYDYLTVVGKKTYNSYTLTFQYRYNGKTVAAMRKAMRQGALEMLASAESKSSALGKEKALHDTLVATCSYDSSAQTNKDLNSVSYTAYGIFVNKKAVCDGYARALKILLSSAGIKSAYVTGTASNSAGEWEDHGWDMAYVSGRWYYVDATFDDPVYVDSQGREISGSGDRVSYSYFNFSSKSDHVLGKFNGSNPFDDNSQNYETMP